MTTGDQKKKLYRRVQKAKRAIERSGSIPPHLKSFLLTFAGFASSVCDYEVVWASQTHLAQTCGYVVGKDGTCRTIKRHISLLRKIGAIEVRRMGIGEAKSWFLMRYEYRLKTCSEKHLQNFYVIDWNHPLWQQGNLDPEMLDEHRKTNRGKIKKRVDESTRDSGGRFKKRTHHSAGESGTMENLGVSISSESDAVTRFKAAEPGHACPDRTGSHVTRKKKTERRTVENASPSSSLSVAPPPPAVISSPTGTAARQPCSHDVRATTVPARHPVRDVAQKEPTQVIGLACGESKAATSRDLFRNQVPGAEEDSLTDLLTPEEHELLEVPPQHVLTSEDLELLEVIGLAACESKAAGSSLCRNQIPRAGRGSLARVLDQPFDKNGVPRIESDLPENPSWLQWQRPELRKLELAGRGRGS